MGGGRMPFEPEKDPEDKKIYLQSRKKYYCEDRFSGFINVGDNVDVDEKVTRIYYPSEIDQTHVTLAIYSTPRRGARYIDERDMSKLGSVTVSMPDKSGGIDRKVEVTMYFGRTEIEMIGKDINSGEKVKTRVKFSQFY